MIATRFSPILDPLTNSDGLFSMLALDQREALRTMMAGTGDASAVSDRSLAEFKATTTRILTPHASAVLLDRDHGIPEDAKPPVAEGCALILAADVLHQRAGEAAHATSFDEQLTVEFVHRTGAAALKILLLWNPDSGRGERRAHLDAFFALCADAKVAAIVEGVVVPPVAGFAPGERDAWILRAAEELAPGADLYKAQVPGYSAGDLSSVRESSERLSSAISVPWVVLSNGVGQQEFAGAVERACLGGAGGFLAGRAIWADAVTDEDRELSLRQRAIPRLAHLREVVATSAAARAEPSGRGVLHLSDR